MSLHVAASLLALLAYGGLLILSLRQGVAGNRPLQIFALYLFNMALMQVALLIVSLADSASQALFWYKVLAPLGGAQFIIFFFFTRTFWRPTLRNRWLSVAIALGILLTVIGLSFVEGTIYSEIHRDQATGLFVPTFGPLSLALGLPIVTYWGLAALNLVRGYQAARSSLQRRRLQYLLLSMVPITIGMVANFLPATQPYPIDLIASAISAFLIAYAILRYKLLDISLVVRKGLVYSTLTIILGVSYFLVIYFATRLFHSLTDSQIFALSTVVAIIAAAVAQPLHGRVQNWIDKALFREQYNSSAMIQRLSRSATSVLDLEKLTDMILDDVTRTMHIQWAAIFLERETEPAPGRSVTRPRVAAPPGATVDSAVQHDGKQDLYLAAQRGLETDAELRIGRGHPLHQWLSRHERALSLSELERIPEARSLGQQEWKDWLRTEVQLFIPLKARDELIGALAIGPRRSQQLYSPDDELVLMTLANQTAVAIDNARLHQAERQRSAELARSNKEKEVLLKEIHHRVKNNLQVISSLLSLQSSCVQEPHTLEVLRESQYRIRSMALIHEKLYQAHDLSRVDLAGYARDLAAYLFWVYGAGERAISLRVQGSGVFLEIDTAVSCGLLLNELISNALKHAFPDDRAGQICVSLEMDGDHQVRLKVSDDGIGLPAELGPGNAESLGLEIVYALVEQLEGTIEVDRRRGTSFEVVFAVPENRS